MKTSIIALMCIAFSLSASASAKDLLSKDAKIWGKMYGESNLPLVGVTGNLCFYQKRQNGGKYTVCADVTTQEGGYFDHTFAAFPKGDHSDEEFTATMSYRGGMKTPSYKKEHIAKDEVETAQRLVTGPYRILEVNFQFPEIKANDKAEVTDHTKNKADTNIREPSKPARTSRKINKF